MQIQRIQNYNPQFNGILKIKNFKDGGEITKKTSCELDKGLADSALKNIFEGSWTNEGGKNIQPQKLNQYIEAIRQTLGIHLHQNKKINHIELKHFDNGYNIKADKEYEITHIRDDIYIWD